MRTIYVVGASHGVRISKALQTLPGYGTVFTVFCLCIRGKPYEELVWPEFNELRTEDILLVVPFGNNIVEKKYVSFDRVARIIHLTAFVPRSREYFNRIFDSLQKKLEQFLGHIYVVNNFYRHFCCPRHNHVNFVAYQNQINKAISDRFNSQQKVKVLDHRSLLGIPLKKARNILEYRKLQTDSVHFRSYGTIAKRILESVL